MDQKFIPGQRWVNQAELQLGLGTVVSVEHRTVTLLFSSSGETRTYSRQSAPLSRVIYKPGDRIKIQDGTELIVQSTEEVEDGLYRYTGKHDDTGSISIHEIEINGAASLHGPAERLLAGLVDDSKWFHLRQLALDSLNYIYHHPASIITGCRVDLLPHQLYIANEVSKRFAPRVLLADEVGLGKTIEAGLIIHQQLYTEQIRRVLIVVPDNLLHQWLVEMLRRFNLRFSLFDSERHQEVSTSQDSENPFLGDQLVLCGLQTVTNNKLFYDDLESAGWDMLVVDEAHHLNWSPEEADHSYIAINSLALSIPGVLLLTATPEQLGKAGHFARLRILDPDRFHDFNHFIEEEKNYQPVATIVKELLDTETPDVEILDRLENALGDDLLKFRTGSAASGVLGDKMKNNLIHHLVDLHGTGRVLFRNTRAAVSGFPERQLYAYPLPVPEPYREMDYKNAVFEQALSSLELCYQSQESKINQHWMKFDPRVNWLVDQLSALKPEKVLLITHARQTVLDLAEYLKTRHGIYAAVFHEDMTILERDRAAEYFADPENGASIMICSEIGSEGRNFQFVHHLVLFDLPLVPDLLEQRIGRLDRIGQTQTVKIHVPYIQSTSQEVLFRWYRDGLEAFYAPCQTGQAIYQQYHMHLIDFIIKNNDAVDDFIAETRDTNRQLLADLENGRDRLLEFNSCPPDTANDLKLQAMKIDNDNFLDEFMGSVFDCFGIDSEEHSERNLILRPGEDMVSAFPHLPDEGMTITYDRQTALVHENWHFLSWAHPMVTGSLDLALSYENGNATAVSFNTSDILPGTLLLESNYILQISPDQDFVLRNLIPPRVIRLVISEDGTHYESKLDHNVIESSKSTIDKATISKIVSMKQSSIRELIEKSRASAMTRLPDEIKSSREIAVEHIQTELDRLEALSRVNENIRQDEINFLNSQAKKVNTIFSSVTPRLDAVRLLIAT